jgi:predicted enzyme related to lactoylglutathione lyase
VNDNCVGWFEIYVQDIDRAKAFFESVFETKLEKIGLDELEMWAFPWIEGAPGAAGALIHMPGFPSGGNSTLVYFGSEDCAVEEARVVAAGGRIERPKMSIGDYGFITLAYDTEGNMFGIHSPSGT